MFFCSLLQVQHAAAVALRSGMAELEAKMAELVAKSDADRQQLLARMRELEEAA